MVEILLLLRGMSDKATAQQLCAEQHIFSKYVSLKRETKPSSRSRQTSECGHGKPKSGEPSYDLNRAESPSPPATATHLFPSPLDL